MAGLLLEQTESTLSTLLVVHRSFSICRQSVVMARNLTLVLASSATIFCRPPARRTAILAPSWWSRRLWRVGGDASGLEDGEEPLAVVGEVVQGAAEQRPSPRRHVFCMARTTADTICGGAHQGVAGGLLLGELVHHHGRLVHHNLERTQTRRGSASRCTAVGVGGSRRGGRDLHALLQGLGNMAARTRCARVMAQPSMEGAEVVTPDWMPESRRTV
ncbi:hypothetical protein CRUP_021624 [Coryphaenoides rupestris]|nr:hypothetical protein CRUP_021624 [Coryphaenoides rupestris]